MRCEEFGERLARERRARKLGTQKDFGVLLGEWSSNLGRKRGPVPEETVCRWEKGRHWPEEWHAYVLCNVFSTSPETLGLEDILSPARKAAIDAELSSDPGAAVVHASLQPDVSSVVGRALRTLPVDWDRMASLLVATRRLDQRALTDLRRLTDFYGSQQLELGPHALLPAVSSHLVELRRQLVVADTHAVRQELATMAGETAVLTGELWHTLLDYGEAAQAFRFAIDLADEYAEGRIRAAAMTSLAALFKNRLHHDEGIPGPSRQAVNLMNAAESSLGDGSPAHQRVWLFSARAWQHAALKERLEAERDLQAAERALAETTGPTTGILAPWDVNYYYVSRARVSQLLGMPRAAVGWYERMVNGPARPGTDDLRRLHFTLKMVAACVEAKELDRAGSLLSNVVDVVIASGIAMLRRRVQIIMRSEPALAAQPDVKVLGERLDDVVIP
jgi:hypothetical protein